jgi:hypothetical protein
MNEIYDVYKRFLKVEKKLGLLFRGKSEYEYIIDGLVITLFLESGKLLNRVEVYSKYGNKLFNTNNETLKSLAELEMYHE